MHMHPYVMEELARQREQEGSVRAGQAAGES